MIKLEIHSADCQRCIVEKNRERKKILDSENKQRENQATEKSIENIFNIIKEELTNTIDKNIEHITVYNSNFSTYKYIRLDDYSLDASVDKEEVINIVTELLTTAGYTARYYEYSKGWQKQSGKWGQITVEW